MPLLADTLVDPSGAPIIGALVKVRLRTDPTVIDATGFNPGDDTTIATVAATSTGAAGVYLIDLPGNSDLLPAGSYYEVTFSHPTGAWTSPPVPIEMPAAGGPYTLENLSVLPSPSVGQLIDYTPTLFGNGLTCPASTYGSYQRYGSSSLGYLELGFRVTGNWSGAGFMELALPPGWTASAARESFLHGFGIAFPTLGVHWPSIGVVHAGASRFRAIVAKDEAATTNVGKAFAIDGVNFPAALTGDGNPANQDRFDWSGLVHLA